MRPQEMQARNKKGDSGMQSDEQKKNQAQDLPLVDRIEQFERFMRECQACQQEVSPNWQFCAHCGIRRSTACPGCQKPLPPVGAPSCPNCGFTIPQRSS
jgi:predicted amidophosphoribosyltransferase